MTLTRLFDHISDKTQPVREGSHGLSVVCAITASATNQRPARSAELLHVGADKNIFLKIEGDLCGLYRSTRCPFSIAWLIISLSWMVLTLWLIISITDSKYEGDIHAFNLWNFIQSNIFLSNELTSPLLCPHSLSATTKSHEVTLGSQTGREIHRESLNV